MANAKYRQWRQSSVNLATASSKCFCGVLLWTAMQIQIQKFFIFYIRHCNNYTTILYLAGLMYHENLLHSNELCHYKTNHAVW